MVLHVFRVLGRLPCHSASPWIISGCHSGMGIG
jgi:hypothetical protein